MNSLVLFEFTVDEPEPGVRVPLPIKSPRYAIGMGPLQVERECTTGSVYPNLPLSNNIKTLAKQEAFKKCWAHSPLRAAARSLF